ncbi:MAG: methionine adenosyltransferase [Clostridia bacterium]|nr:methionine adenosyltransferase [Clostridia bacterium]
MRRLFTSESVTEGHPDKLCDLISDTVLDAYLEKDPDSRVACEVTASTGLITVMGEITSKAVIDIQPLIREAIREVGYTDSSMGFDADTCSVMNTVHGQSPDIAQGVGDNNDENSGAGDQGLIFGFACSETETLMPLPIYLAHKLSERLTFVRKSGILTYLRPDGKTQVTVEYDENDVPKRIDAIVVSTQHSEDVTLEQIKEDVIKHVITPVIDEKMMDDNTKIYINPTGRFVIGGPFGDSGLTGRKIIVDTYGGYARHGGGAFSGKDPSKVDRSAAYMARYIAKNLVAASLCEKCEIQLAYAIGVAKPVSVRVDTFGTGKLSEDKLEELVMENFDLRPYGIIKTLGLRNPIYKKTSNYGHMGKAGLPWEETNMAETLKKAANI